VNIIPTTSHPAWCDPRACTALLNHDGSPNYQLDDARLGAVASARAAAREVSGRNAPSCRANRSRPLGPPDASYRGW